jgi:hypothetical protein
MATVMGIAMVTMVDMAVAADARVALLLAAVAAVVVAIKSTKECSRRCSQTVQKVFKREHFSPVFSPKIIVAVDTKTCLNE